MEAGGEGIETRAPRRAADGRRARRHPARLALGGDAGRGGPDPRRRTRSRPAWTTRAPAPSTPTCATAAAPATWPSPTTQALAAFRELARLEGIIPALETAHALAWVLAQDDGELDLVCLSGRGDKDLAEVLGAGESGAAASRGEAAGASGERGIERSRRRAASGRAALMPYLMGGFPTLEQSLRIGEACVQAGADVIELGVPYSDPLADGPVIHAAGTRALAAGANVAGVLEVARALSASVPVVLMCYANMVFAPGVGGVRRAPRADRGVRADRARPAARGGAGGARRRCDEHGLALVPLVAPTTTPERMAEIGASARGFLYTVSVVGTTGERSALGERLAADHRARQGVHRACRWRSASGSARPSRRCRRRDAGADGVIVGTRLVRAAGEARGPRGGGRARSSANWLRGSAPAR